MKYFIVDAKACLQPASGLPPFIALNVFLPFSTLFTFFHLSNITRQAIFAALGLTYLEPHERCS
jgi:hypothetical protein